MRCSVCAERLEEGEFDGSLCRFHVGAFAGGVWRCCNAQGDGAPGCAAGCHVRDEASSAHPAVDGEDSAAADAEAEAAAPSEPFINVVLGASDTLAGIALRYSTTPEARRVCATDVR